jgi:hypothetical protein
MENIKYDVFLSRKSEDAHMASKFFDYLTKAGFSVFVSDSTISTLGNSDYSKVIDMALRKTMHLIVIGSKYEFFEEPIGAWIEYEWRTFLNIKRNSKNNGNLLTIIPESLEIGKLPIGLQNYQVLKYSFDNETIDFDINYVSKRKETFNPEPLPQLSFQLQYELEKSEKKIENKKYHEAYCDLFKFLTDNDLTDAEIVLLAKRISEVLVFNKNYDLARENYELVIAREFTSKTLTYMAHLKLLNYLGEEALTNGETALQLAINEMTLPLSPIIKILNEANIQLGENGEVLQTTEMLKEIENLEKNPVSDFLWLKISTLFFKYKYFSFSNAILFKLSQKGNSRANYGLFYSFFHGKGLAKNSKSAFEYLRIAVNQKHPRALYTYGFELIKGRNIMKNEIDGLAYIKEAARLGLVLAQNFLEKNLE